MRIGMIGLGKMGLNMTKRLIDGGHEIVVYDRSEASMEAARTDGAEVTHSVAALVEGLQAPRVVWVMVPAGAATDEVISTLADHLTDGDIIIDGGNSNYRDTIERSKRLRALNLHLVDVGTSGGVWGLTEGYSLMVGGEHSVVSQLNPLFETLAPAPDQGWGYVGPSGAGHFVKMVHNGIEYGLMQAYAEGFAILDQKAEFHLDLRQVAEIWRHGSVVRSWLLDLTANALEENPDLEGIAPYVSDSGEGRWTVQEAIDLDVSAPVITLSLLQRLRSRTENSYADRLLAALRNQFGGHAVKKQ